MVDAAAALGVAAAEPVSLQLQRCPALLRSGMGTPAALPRRLPGSCAAFWLLCPQHLLRRCQKQRRRCAEPAQTTLGQAGAPGQPLPPPQPWLQPSCWRVSRLPCSAHPPLLFAPPLLPAACTATAKLAKLTDAVSVAGCKGSFRTTSALCWRRLQKGCPHRHDMYTHCSSARCTVQ